MPDLRRFPPTYGLYGRLTKVEARRLAGLGTDQELRLSNQYPAFESELRSCIQKIEMETRATYDGGLSCDPIGLLAAAQDFLGGCPDHMKNEAIETTIRQFRTWSLAFGHFRRFDVAKTFGQYAQIIALRYEAQRHSPEQQGNLKTSDVEG